MTLKTKINEYFKEKDYETVDRNLEQIEDILKFKNKELTKILRELRLAVDKYYSV